MSAGKQQPNLLDLVPVRLREHELDGDRVAVLVPRFRSRLLGWLQRRLRRPHLRVRLDQVGSSVWLDCDGTRRVSEIGARLRERFGDEVEPVWDRLGFFMRQMHRGDFIDLRE